MTRLSSAHKKWFSSLCFSWFYMEITQVNDLNLDLALFHARHGLGTRLFFLDWIDREPSLSPHCPIPPTLLPSSPPPSPSLCHAFLLKRRQPVSFLKSTKGSVPNKTNFQYLRKVKYRNPAQTVKTNFYSFIWTHRKTSVRFTLVR